MGASRINSQGDISDGIPGACKPRATSAGSPVRNTRMTEDRWRICVAGNKQKRNKTFRENTRHPTDSRANIRRIPALKISSGDKLREEHRWNAARIYVKTLK